MTKLGTYLKEKRLEQAKTQLELAQEMEVSRMTYVCYERGTRKPSLKTIRKISRLYGIEIPKINRMLGE